MPDVIHVIIPIQMIILSIIIVFTWIYALPIILIRRFHTATNILTCNVCIVSFICAVYWTVYYILYGFYPTMINVSRASCTIVPYFQTVVNCLVVYALTMITINRYFLVTYPSENLFKKHRWSLMSSAVQWVAAITLPLPYLTHSSTKCTHVNMIPLWIRIYRLTIMVLVPSILHGLFNLLIFHKVKRSTKHLMTVSKRSSSTIFDFHLECFNARDVCLLRHMLFIHTVFVVGWAPNSLLSIAEVYVSIPSTIHLLSRLLPPVSLLVNIIDLFLYNHELRRYLRKKARKYFVFK